MRTEVPLQRHDHLSFKGNLKETRYGWLRLTPAYSVHLVGELLEAERQPKMRVLDPFCGTGTTALVCAERGIPCDTTDINPFLLWLATAKSRQCSSKGLAAAAKGAAAVERAIRKGSTVGANWVPPIHQIEKWWDERTLAGLAASMAEIRLLEQQLEEEATDLLKVAFCRTMIERANVSFGHQSMSFKKPSANLSLVKDEDNLVAETWSKACRSILASAQSPILKQPKVIGCDARNLRPTLKPNSYSCVITSPPYPNRMSYIRELRPYMYWLGYLKDGREAGELDWKAIGGTWGCATSNVGKWSPEKPSEIPHEKFAAILEEIAGKSALLSRYVHKYFYDMVDHCAGLFEVVRPAGTIHYVVGNSKFYDVMLPVEDLFAALFTASGFEKVAIRTIRKRSSKKELFEFVVSAQKPIGRA